ncbi:membrane-bound lytic murein transglycosylase E [Buchnera aphidicola str. Bp (Baizongia pistaciae)]|uniref:Membrane-bound lytic murein transglycosylase E n=1 Tax=Buchnera aphidicola subsp. Baizongia pistaciae (strain Bp) TaxID=224915 RepID=MLTE_BUCBP|nr:transglycosylase SLT domain-containing protein [Buchnera aphidicola]Q89AM2.1 RecName: Full=Membrane-bound lytic murein transglycosylase E; AltName: Full=Murein hydrolase E [Buchnera aphidicola str. Bp (Baizongia pistaciae)]AAO26972.1 membrane-bound lytic murein transglycosylase E [Buchnera aphidicola str. Bp (Baizongia pistaciae)]
MKKVILFTYVIIFLVFLSGYSVVTKNIVHNIKNNYKNNVCSMKVMHLWFKIINLFSKKYNVDKKLITAIICVESSGNTHAVSISKAIGLMQIKPFSAGREVYRFRGLLNQPSDVDLYDPKINIDIGTSYINILRNKILSGIKNSEILLYATIISYAHGASKLLKSFSYNKTLAIKKINKMKIKEFLDYIHNKYSEKKAWDYLSKVMYVYHLV